MKCIRAVGRLPVLRKSFGHTFKRNDSSNFSSCDVSNQMHKKSLEDPSKFWGSVAEDIKWLKRPDKVLDISKTPFFRWFLGGLMNTCYNCLDRHIEDGFGDQIALIYDSPVTQTIRKISYSEMSKEVNTFAGLLVEQGIKKGERVMIYMPNSPEAVIAMLACARIGAVHTVVFGGFAAPELATRIRDCTPKLIIASSCGIDGSKIIAYKPLLDEAIEFASNTHRVKKCIIHQREQGIASMIADRDINWKQGVAGVKNPVIECVHLESSDPLYILYTSGTTGAPKGVLRDNGGHAVALKWSMENVYGMKPGDVWWAASDVGWVVGHSFIVYAPFLHRCTSVIYEGKPIGTPDESNFWRTVERHGVNALFTAPTVIRVLKKTDPNGLLPANFNLSSLRTLFLAGERADPATLRWAEDTLKIPVRDNWWQTETGWPICANMVGVDGYIKVKYGSSYKPVPGFDVHVLDEQHNHVPAGTLGTLAIKLPLPPGSLISLYNNDKRFLSSYLETIPGYYDTGDAGIIDCDGYVSIMSRTDDIINVSGHRLSCGAMEEVRVRVRVRVRKRLRSMS
jgi:propionyl-CoA synthetase